MLWMKLLQESVVSTEVGAAYSLLSEQFELQLFLQHKHSYDDAPISHLSFGQKLINSHSRLTNVPMFEWCQS